MAKSLGDGNPMFGRKGGLMKKLIGQEMRHKHCSTVKLIHPKADFLDIPKLMRIFVVSLTVCRMKPETSQAKIELKKLLNSIYKTRKIKAITLSSFYPLSRCGFVRDSN